MKRRIRLFKFASVAAFCAVGFYVAAFVDRFDIFSAPVRSSDGWLGPLVRGDSQAADAGSNIDAQDRNGATPLHRAVRTRCAAAVKCLLDAGADPTIRNQPGSTPFHLAVQNTGRGGTGSEKGRTAQREILQAFLARGVSPALTDARGKSVLEWARSDWIHQILVR